MQVPQPIMDKSVTVGGYLASVGTAIGGWVSLNNIALLLGIISTVLLTVIQYRRYRKGINQDAEYHAARMAALKDGVITEVADGNK